MALVFQLGCKADNRIRDIRRKLASLKYLEDKGKCTSAFSTELFEALKAFQADHQLEQHGKCDGPTWQKLDELAGSVFHETWQYELDALDPAAPAAEIGPADEDAVIAKAHARNLAGVAFSGGGIRSATFNLGILQALAEHGLLRDFDYLSTVSGGGYIGAWFSKWLERYKGNTATLEGQLSPGTAARPVRQEPEEIRFLRQYSNYLTPKTGLLSADTWALFATYFRNTVLNMCILVALLAALLVIPRMLTLLVAEYGASNAAAFGWVAGLTALWAVMRIAMSVSYLPDGASRSWLRGQSQGNILCTIVLPLMVSAFAASVAIWYQRPTMVADWRAIGSDTAQPLRVAAWIVGPGIAYFLAWSGGWAWARHLNAASRKPPAGEGLGHFLCAVAAVGVGAALLLSVVNALTPVPAAALAASEHADALMVVTLGMPLMLSIFGLAMILSVGLVGRMYEDKSREWWSRQGGWTTISTLGWTALVALSLYAPPLIGYAWASAPVWAKLALGGGWAGTTLAGLAVGRSSDSGKRNSNPYLEWLAALAPSVFSIGALLLVSTLAYLMLLPDGALTLGSNDDFTVAMLVYPAEAGTIKFVRSAAVLCLLLTVAGVLAWRVDINKFSLYMMYRNRLVRAYLGATNLQRRPHPFTGFDDRDDIHMEDLSPAPGKLQRPCHIVNTTLNLVNGKELAWQTRKAAGFVFTPAFCGYEMPSMAAPAHRLAADEAARGCYRPTAQYRYPQGESGPERDGIKLGMAVAVSGAAASPSMGFHSSPALTFLMTLFNVRLGRWFANPLSSNWWRTSPRLGIWYLVKELFGLTDARAGYVYLSDGGHFENLGVYELVRRRCRLIVVIDAAADGGLQFEDLGNAIRKCSTDLHVDIEIDVGQIDRLPVSEFSRAYCVAGKIRYDSTDQGAQAGTLLYIKPSLLGSECADVLNYRKANLDFPHQSTADQWFDETQFESYRTLGHHIGSTVLRNAAATATDKDGRHSVKVLCDALQQQWGADRRAHPPIHSVKQRRQGNRRQA